MRPTNTHARACAPDHAYYAAAKDRIDGKRAALSEARRIIRQACHIPSGLGDDRSPRRDRRPVSPAVTRRHPGTASGAALTRWGTTAASSRHAAVSRPACSAGHADGLKRLSGRIPPAGGETPNHHHAPGQGLGDVARHIISLEPR
jgi:hypothetical protein